MPSPPILSPYLQIKRFRAVKPYLIGDVLDLGCGQAELAEYLNPGQAYFGVEGDQERVTKLQRLYPTLNFLTFDLDSDRLDVGRQFDTITMIAVIEHLDHPSKLLSQLPALLTPNGRLVITTPSPFGDRIHRIGARLGLFSMIAAEDHSQIYSYKALSELLVESAFEISHFHSFLLGGNQLIVCKPSLIQASGGW